MTTANKHEPDDGQVDLSFDEYEETEVSVGGNESEEKEAKEEPVIEVSEEKADSGDEHEEYSTSVKKRIDRLTKKMREAERRETEAIKYAQNVQAESQQIKSRLQTVDQGYMTEYGNRLNIEQKQVEDTLKDAMDKGDTGAAVAAQRKLTQLAVSADRYTSVQNNRKQQAAQAAAQPQPQPQPPIPQQPVEQPPDPKAEKWAEKNNWFGKDEAMTFAAFGIHKGMVEKEGFDPQSDDYYDELDSRLRNKFPQEFNNGSGKRPVQNVAGNSRSRGKTSGRSRKVKLTPSQVAIAHKLGVPLEEYAKYVKT
jgi:hypothetical protein